MIPGSLPLVLSAYKASASGSKFSFDQQSALTCSEKRAMLVDAIRFANVDSPGASLSLLSMELRLGRVPLTNGMVPVAHLAPIANQLATAAQYYAPGDGFVEWRFARPLFVPPGLGLHPLFGINTVGGITGVVSSFSTAVLARVMPANFPALNKVAVPYVTSYGLNAPDIAGGADAGSIDVPPDTLSAPGDAEVFHVQYIGVRPLNMSSKDDMASYVDEARNMTLTLHRANGDAIIPRATPVRMVGGQGWALPVKLDLKRGEPLYAHIDYDFSAFSASLKFRPSVQLIGWREVDLREV